VCGSPWNSPHTAERVLSASNLRDWHDLPFRDLLQRETQIPTRIENGVNLAALGESWQGAVRGTANFVFLAVGTGVGCGYCRKQHGRPWRDLVGR
jgi:glucokinase